MREETFRRLKKMHEKKLGRQLTDEEFKEIWMKKQWRQAKIVWPLCLIIALALVADWPGTWIPLELFLGLTFSQSLGLILIIISIGGFTNDYIKHKRGLM